MKKFPIERGVRAQLERVEQAAGVVAVVVGEEDPAHVLRLDEREDLLEPELAVDRGTGVDDHGLGASDQHGVDRDVGPVAARGTGWGSARSQGRSPGAVVVGTGPSISRSVSFVRVVVGSRMLTIRARVRRPSRPVEGNGTGQTPRLRGCPRSRRTGVPSCPWRHGRCGWMALRTIERSCAEATRWPRAPRAAVGRPPRTWSRTTAPAWFGADPGHAARHLTGAGRGPATAATAIRSGTTSSTIQDTAQFVDLARGPEPAAALRLSLDGPPHPKRPLPGVACSPTATRTSCGRVSRSARTPGASSACTGRRGRRSPSRGRRRRDHDGRVADHRAPPSATTSAAQSPWLGRVPGAGLVDLRQQRPTSCPPTPRRCAGCASCRHPGRTRSRRPSRVDRSRSSGRRARPPTSSARQVSPLWALARPGPGGGRRARRSAGPPATTRSARPMARAARLRCSPAPATTARLRWRS